jgi:hypothetical protein
MAQAGTSPFALGAVARALVLLPSQMDTTREDQVGQVREVIREALAWAWTWSAAAE